MLNKSLYAWQLNYLQFLLGAVFAFFYDITAIFTVIVYCIAQAIFTVCVFSKVGASNSKSIIKMFFLGEFLKIILLVLLILSLAMFVKINFLSMIVTLLVLHGLSFLGPLLL